jgi:hypothetical protein
MENLIRFWKAVGMIAVMGVMAVIVWNQQHQHSLRGACSASNHIRYTKDSIVFFKDNSGHYREFAYGKDDMKELKRIFKKADELGRYCERKATFEVVKNLAMLGDAQFKYKYETDMQSSWLEINCNSGRCNSKIVLLRRQRFMSYLVKYKRINMRSERNVGKKMKRIDEITK